MLSYQHQYHAGNHADVLKHWLLVECLVHMRKKDTPFDYIDSHAGSGRYRLDSQEAQKTGEYKLGIAKLIDKDWPELSAYLDLVRADLGKQQYPGSPEIVNRLLRHGDHSSLFELHSQAVRELEQNCARKRQTQVRFEDGLAGMNALLPVHSRRALVLVDPSYEVKTEYDAVTSAVEKAWKKMSQSTILLWYPVVERSRIDRMERRLVRSGIKNMQLFEMSVADDGARGMTGSGLIAINPPWTVAERFNKLFPLVSAALSSDGTSRTRVKILTAE